MPNEFAQRVVLDVNVLVSGYLFPTSPPGKVLEHVLQHDTLLMSLEVAAEAAAVLRREKFDRYLAKEVREELLAATIRVSSFIQTITAITSCRDAQDNKVLELAVDGGAAFIVTGDTDLLMLHPFRGISILKPSDFLSTHEVRG
jgi:putative PIN family toxin of toxin-antitoxin system